MSRIVKALFFLLLAIPGLARADIFLGADVALSRAEAATGAHAYDLSINLPQSLARPGDVTLPDGCHQTAMTRQGVGANVQIAISFSCNRAFRPDDVIATPWKVDGARFSSSVLGAGVDRSLSGGDAGLVLPVGEAAASARSIGDIARAFMMQGVWHIWMGWDHLCFVLCLALLARGRQLVSLITAFTLGHSLSLGLAFFDLVHVPVPPVEAAIALSITFMAREALMALRGVTHGFARHVTVVSAFGLLHGLGFATALGELGVAQGEKMPALLFFNLGVECGQLLFVGALLLTFSSLSRVGADRPMRLAALYGAGMIGAFWMCERVAGFVA